jgi:peptidoglycan LD-endopeptidase LytH
MGRVNRQRTYLGRLAAGLAASVVLGLAACSTAPLGPSTLGPSTLGPSTLAPSTPGPASPSPEPSPSAGSSQPPSPAGPAQVATGPYLFPVSSHVGYARTHHDYPATDIIAPCSAPVVAVTDGVVLEVSRVDKFDPGDPEGALKGGLSVSIMGTDGVRYYGSHLSKVAAGIEAGVHVRAGTPLGLVGKTGNASVCHLHFGISPVCMRTGDWWTRRGVIWPWPYLDSWRAGQPLSPVAEVARWERTHGCPTVAPSR